MDLETIDWALALKQMGNDAPFLMEVLSDVLVEAKDMLPALQTAINTRNGDVVAAAGAQIHQSASPLFCHKLSRIAESLEGAGKHVKSAEDWSGIEALVGALSAALADLKAETARFHSNGNAPVPAAQPETHSSSSVAAAVRAAKSLPSIDWDSAMTAVGEDHEFLVDVLSDFVSAASAGISSLSAAMISKDLVEIKDVGHSIKGAAKPLKCYRIETIATLIETSANPNNNPGGATSAKWSELSALCEEYSACVFCLWSEIQSPGSANLPSTESNAKNTIIANIDWEGALEKTGNDKNFLSEVLVDVIHEADKGVSKLTECIESKDFDMLKKTAHRIKGGANSVNCHRLASVSLRIEMTAKEGLALPSNLSQDDEVRAMELWEQVEGLLREYRIHLMALKAEIAKKKDHKEHKSHK